MKPAALFALTIAAGGIVVLSLLFKPPAGSEPIALVSSRQCLECHPGVAAEWQDSHRSTSKGRILFSKNSVSLSSACK